MHKMANLKELIDDGYIHEANRQFFHPLGLALRWNFDPNRSISYLDIIDNRDDPTGVFFQELDQEKMASIWEKQLKAREIRSTLPFCNGDGIQDEDMD